MKGVYKMTVYELIQELVKYPADAEVCAAVGNSTQKFDIEDVGLEFKYPNTYPNRAVISLDM